MIWFPFPSRKTLTDKIFRKYESLEGIENIEGGLVIAYFLSCQRAKNLCRRKHGKKANSL